MHRVLTSPRVGGGCRSHARRIQAPKALVDNLGYSKFDQIGHEEDGRLKSEKHQVQNFMI